MNDSKKMSPTSHQTSVDTFLSKEPEAHYLEEWKEVLTKERRGEEIRKEESVIIFKLGQEMLAIPTVNFVEVLKKRTIHSIPHRTENILMGIVNFRGQLIPCFALHKLIEVAGLDQNIYALEDDYSHMLAIQNIDTFWVFPVDQVHECHAINYRDLENVPITITQSPINFLKGIFNWKNHKVSLIDPDLMLRDLKKRIS